MSEHYRRAKAWRTILAKIDALSGDLSPDALAPLDQFHSGGLAACASWRGWRRSSPANRFSMPAAASAALPACLPPSMAQGPRHRSLRTISSPLPGRCRRRAALRLSSRQANALQLPFGDALVRSRLDAACQHEYRRQDAALPRTAPGAAAGRAASCFTIFYPATKPGRCSFPCPGPMGRRRAT